MQETGAVQAFSKGWWHRRHRVLRTDKTQGPSLGHDVESAYLGGGGAV